MKTMWDTLPKYPVILSALMHTGANEICNIPKKTSRPTSCFHSPSILTRPVRGPLCLKRPTSSHCAETLDSAALGNPSLVSGTLQWRDQQVPEKRSHPAPPETLPGKLARLADPNSGMYLRTNPTRTAEISRYLHYVLFTRRR